MSLARKIAHKIGLAGGGGHADSIEQALRKKFERYTTTNLQNISAQDFQREIQGRIDTVDSKSEGYAESEKERQRDLSIKFRWGHNHDFGSFKMDGQMKDRHLRLMADFMSLFSLAEKDFENKDIFDVGCWTGGTTLLLASFAKSVLAIEEVHKYAETASFLARSFGLADRINIEARSLYSCNVPELQDRFDVVYYPGVIYHVSDPLLSLRILFNSLKIDGFILVETAGIDVKEPLCQFDGSLIYTAGIGAKERMNRGGWNWFLPSASALHRMMREAGFDDVSTLWHYPTNRVFGFGRKIEQVGICKAGLSVTDIR